MLENFNSIFTAILDPTSIWSVVARAVIWFVIAGVIIVSVDQPKPEQTHRSLKKNLGLFLLILTVGGGLMYLLFSFTHTTS